MDLMIIKEDLKNFLDDRDRLISYPSKFRLKIISLFYMVSKFETGRRYAEKEVNEILLKWHNFDDWCMLRRELYNKRFMCREHEQNRTFYWLEENQPKLSDFNLE